ncbi:hypothetical protein [Mesorhizobium sp. WSM4887]|uniref:hypothetical protein n=1 Tax=Mesorhizobium sp. WSM4887 TaxID=3038543 RepID=UPI002416F77E|nr:hypothetical protein [Mesorhizobium sp. WSM4887]MDG4885770.1 hypothetical protein [Mesorhizobium sp. WSM4887]
MDTFPKLKSGSWRAQVRHGASQERFCAAGTPRSAHDAAPIFRDLVALHPPGLKKMGIKILDPRTSVGTGLDFNRTLRAFFGEEQRHFFCN